MDKIFSEDTPSTSDRYDAIFGNLMVVTEDATGLETSTTVDPQAFHSSIVAKSKDYKENFCSVTKQRDYITECIEAGNKYSSLLMSVSDKTKPLSDILTITTGRAKTIKDGSSTVLYPKLKKEEVGEFNSAITAYLYTISASIDAALSLQRKKLHLQKTIDKVAAHFSIHRKSANFDSFIYFHTAILLEKYSIDVANITSNLISVGDIIDDPLDHGAFIHISGSQTRKPMMNSLIPEASHRVALQVRYKFSLKQMRLLITAIFSSDIDARAAARIELLSTVKQEIRSDVVNNPTETLLRIASENYLTRRELIGVLFTAESEQQIPYTNTSDKNRCQWCRRTIALHNDSFIHPSDCFVTEWIIEHLQCTLSGSTIIVPNLVYAKIDAARYTKQLVQSISRLRHTPNIGRTEDAFIAYKTGDDGQPVKIVQHGVKPVKLTHFTPHLK